MEDETLVICSVLVRAEQNWLLEVLFISSFREWEQEITREKSVRDKSSTLTVAPKGGKCRVTVL